MITKSKSIMTIIVAVAFMAAFMPATESYGTSYFETNQQCGVPTVVASHSVKPNVMIVHDASGSMQEAAYEGLTNYNYYGNKVMENYTVTGLYTPGTSYYGIFEPDTYYRYDSTGKFFYAIVGITTSTGTDTYIRFTTSSNHGLAVNEWVVFTGLTGNAILNGTPYQVSAVTDTTHFEIAQPFKAADTSSGGVWRTMPAIGITTSASGTGGNIRFTTSTNHELIANNWVVFTDLTGHPSLNGNGYQVSAVIDSTHFEIAQPFKTADDATGTLRKRILGDLSTGLSGNLLNYSTTSRIDAALKALVGGRSRPGAAAGFLYIGGQGARRQIDETTNAQALFYVRPCTNGPDDYSTGNYLDKTSYLNLTPKGTFAGKVDSTDPANVNFRTTSNPRNRNTEWWTIRLTAATSVTIITNVVQGYIGVRTTYPSTAPVYNDGSWTVQQKAGSGSTPTVTFTAAANTTYYVAISKDTSTGFSYAGACNVLVTPYVDAITRPHHGFNIPSAITNAIVRLRIPTTLRGGVVKDAYANTRIGFMYYNSDYKGKIVRGCGDATLDQLVSDIESILPYNGTPTGEALWEAYDYFKQSGDHNYSTNSSFINRKGAVDPYYDYDILNQLKFMPCRKSYVLLVSDGEWNGSVDPIRPAREMHYADIRTAVEDPVDTKVQKVDVFTFYAFSDSAAGKNSMKMVAQYGGYSNDCGSSSDNWPYPYSSYTPGSSNSLNVSWPLTSYCNPAGSPYDTCCSEWDKIWDREGDGTNAQKGVPDNYYEATDGAQLEKGLREVFQSIISKTGAAGSVATVAQKVSDHDVIIRAMFRAAGTFDQDIYIWRGSLESYYPFAPNWDYDFDVTTSICKDIPVGSRHCWDAGEIMSTHVADRKIYSVKQTDLDGGSFTLTELSAANVAGFQTQLEIEPENKCVATETETTTATRLINWVRGVDNSCLRSRKDPTLPWPLADLIYSTPLVVGTPSVAGVADTDPDLADYTAYRDWATKKAKYWDDATEASIPPTLSSTIHTVYKKMAYVGGNDGMLHAIVLAVSGGVDATGDIIWIDSRTDVSSCYQSGVFKEPPTSVDCLLRSFVGKELWAYMPSNLLYKIKGLADRSYGTSAGGACPHCAMVDLSPQAFEVYQTRGDCNSGGKTLDTNGDGKCWRTIIVGGERGGGDIFFAMDITDPDNPILLWEYSVLKNLQEYDAGEEKITTIDAYQKYNTGKGTGYYDDGLKKLPLSWSVPYVGRIKVPQNMTMNGKICDEEGGCKWHVAFIGGGFRVFDETITVQHSGTDRTVDLTPLMKPHFLGIDIGTGRNLLGNLWPSMRKAGYQTTAFPSLSRVHDRTNKLKYRIPYAMSDPLVLDEWNGTSSVLGSDGFVDRIYVGDLTGYFYGYKFNLYSSDRKGVLIDVWSTKPISECDDDSFRQNRQPITTRPQAADDTNTNYLRVILAAGKYDDVPGGQDDKLDLARTSLYNLLDERQIPSSDLLSSGIEVGTGSGFHAALRFRCGNHAAPYSSFKSCCSRDRSLCTLDCSACSAGDLPACCSGSLSNCNTGCAKADTTQCAVPADCCKWICVNATTDCTNCSYWVNQSTGEADCAEPSCCNKAYVRNSTPATCNDGRAGTESLPACCDSPPCWACALDLTLPGTDQPNYPGERFVSKPLIAAGTVFVTSYVPQYDPCTAMGTGYLYMFDYQCGLFPTGWNPLADTSYTPTYYKSGEQTYGLRINLGNGPPSDPVLDSRGKYVFVQMGTAEIVKIGVDLNRPSPPAPPDDPLTPPTTGPTGQFRIRGWREIESPGELKP